MSKSQKNQDSRGRFGRGIAAMSLAATLVATTAGATDRRTGPVVSSSEQAITVLRERAAYEGRYLGAANPGAADGTGARATIVGTHSVPPPAMVNRQPTVNSAIGSVRMPAIVSGVDGGGAVIADGGAVTAGATSTDGGAITASAVASGLSGVPAGGFTSSTSGVNDGTAQPRVSSTAARSVTATPVLGGSFLGNAGTVAATPLANTTSNVQSVIATEPLVGTAANAGTVAPLPGVAVTSTTATTVTNATNGSADRRAAARATAARTFGSASVGVTSPVRVVRDASGNVVVTNSTSSSGNK